MAMDISVSETKGIAAPPQATLPPKTIPPHLKEAIERQIPGNEANDRFVNAVLNGETRQMSVQELQQHLKRENANNAEFLKKAEREQIEIVKRQKEEEKKAIEKKQAELKDMRTVQDPGATQPVLDVKTNQPQVAPDGTVRIPFQNLSTNSGK